MGNLIVNFTPFTYEQQIWVYVDGSCVAQFKVPIDKIITTINGLKNKYNIGYINLCGDPEYLAKYKAELSLNFNTAFTKINIVRR